MNRMIRLIAVMAALAVSQLCTAQAPAGAPAGSTGLCNDGTYFKGSVKSGACTGHKGLKTWWGAAKGAPATPAATAPAKTASTPPPAAPAKTTAPPAAAAPAKPTAPPAASSPANASAPAPASKPSTASTAAAPGGGPGLVWVNTASNVYHCPGSAYYGKTKEGAYMTEAQAKAKGGKPNAGRPCSK